MRKFYSIIAAGLLCGSLNAQVSLDEGDVCPDFTVTDLNGVQHTLYDYTSAGKWVLVDFFAYWCGPCAATSPTVNEFYHKYGCNNGSIVVIGVEYEGTDAQTHEFEEWAGINNDNPYPAASGIDGGGAAVHAVYDAAAFPTLIAISPDNILLNSDIWPISGIQTLEGAFPDEALVEMDCAVSVAEPVVLQDFGVSPNPMADQGFLTLALQETAQVELLMTDATGRQVKHVDYGTLSSGMQRFDLRVSDLVSGVYHIRLVVNGVVSGTQTLVKS
ncbi:MAG: hypothetical protein RL220_814 [Bacteroidota bacterium]